MSAGAPARVSDMSGLMLGAAGMFAAMYSSQAILPELASDFDVTPSQAGLTISVVVLAVALAGWIWGPLSDRFGRRRSLLLASGLLVVPSLAAAVAPTFTALLVLRALQGACMPGLLTVGIPYVAEVYVPGLGGRAMGYYTIALVGGGVVGRVGVGLVTSVAGWRIAFALVALLPLAGVILMRRHLPEAPVPERSGDRRVARQLANPAVLVPAITACAFFFTFVGVFSYASFRLQEPPFGFGAAATSLVFSLWALGAIGPSAGRLADRLGWRRVALAGIGLAATGLALTLPSHAGHAAAGARRADARHVHRRHRRPARARRGRAVGPRRRQRDLLLLLLRSGRARRLHPRPGLGAVGLAGSDRDHRPGAGRRGGRAALGAWQSAGMNFELTDRCRDFQERLSAFMEEHIYPAEAVYEEQLRESGDPHSHPPVMEELKQEAPAARPLEPVPPRPERFGAGLTQRRVRAAGGDHAAASPSRPRRSTARRPTPATWRC